MRILSYSNLLLWNGSVANCFWKDLWTCSPWIFLYHVGSNCCICFLWMALQNSFTNSDMFRKVKWLQQHHHHQVLKCQLLTVSLAIHCIIAMIDRMSAEYIFCDIFLNFMPDFSFCFSLSFHNIICIIYNI